MIDEIFHKRLKNVERKRPTPSRSHPPKTEKRKKVEKKEK